MLPKTDVFREPQYRPDVSVGEKRVDDGFGEGSIGRFGEYMG
jgi:hypothetical protein